MDYTISNDIVFRRIDDEMILVNLQTDRIFTLNDTAAQFWELLAEGMSVEQARDQLLDTYDVDANKLDAEITVIVDQLLSEAVIEKRNAA